MSAFRFIHTSDLHLGRRFGNLPEEIRGLLSAARRDVVRTLSDAARTSGAAHVLVAGDLFDTETPSDAIVRQTLNAMGAIPRSRGGSSPATTTASPPKPSGTASAATRRRTYIFSTGPNPWRSRRRVTLLPAPASRRYPGRDLTAWMQGAATGEGDFRIGLAHGAVQTFASEDGGSRGHPAGPGGLGRAPLPRARRLAWAAPDQRAHALFGNARAGSVQAWGQGRLPIGNPRGGGDRAAGQRDPDRTVRLG